MVDSICDGLVSIDGGIMEGGGQILRNAISLSCLTKQNVRITNIRGGRKDPGLKAQHMTGLQLVANICGGELSGATKGSTEVIFKPGSVKASDYSADTKTAGSVCLLMQVSLPCLCFAPFGKSTLKLKGGTNADMAPPIDYFSQVFAPIAAKMGVDFGIKVLRRGYFPKGGGEVDVTVQSVSEGNLKPIDMTNFGEVERIYGYSYVAGALQMKDAHIMADHAEKVLRSRFKNLSIKIDRVQEREAIGSGSGIIVFAETDTGCILAGSSIGSKKKSADEIGRTAGQQLVDELLAEVCVDSFLQDQLILFMALASGNSTIMTGAVTLHTKTSIYIAELLTEAKFTIKRCEAAKSGLERNTITCDGINFQRTSNAACQSYHSSDS